MTIVGARPQFVKAKPVSDALAAAGLPELLVHTGQHYDDAMSGAIFRDLGLREADLDLGVGSGSHGAQTAAMLAGLEEVILDRRPAAVVVFGDTNSTVAGALAAAKLHVPVAHVEAGLRSHNRRMPEELNRIATDHLSDACLAPTASAMEDLAREGLDARSHLVGDVMVDMLRAVDLEGVAVPEWSGEPFVLATIHRAENTDDPDRLRSILEALAGMPLPVRLLAHPRLPAVAERLGLTALLEGGSLELHEPVPYSVMLALVTRSAAVVTDSGGLQKEAFLLGATCTTVRDETEWPETFEGDANRLATPWAVDDFSAVVLRGRSPVAGEPFGDGRAGARCVEVVERLLA